MITRFCKIHDEGTVRSLHLQLVIVNIRMAHDPYYEIFISVVIKTNKTGMAMILYYPLPLGELLIVFI